MEAGLQGVQGMFSFTNECQAVFQEVVLFYAPVYSKRKLLLSYVLTKQAKEPFQRDTMSRARHMCPHSASLSVGSQKLRSQSVYLLPPSMCRGFRLSLILDHMLYS